MEKQIFSKYEKARVIGARGLQISMDAPILLNLKEKELEEINYDPLKIAEKELNSGVLPISVNKPMPKKSEEAIEKVKIEESKISDEKKIRKEREEEKRIAEGGEIMELASSDDESEMPVEEDSMASFPEDDGGDE